MGVKYIWWQHAKSMIRVYPMRKAQYEDIIDIQTIPNNDGLPHGTNVSNPVETALINAEENDAYNDYWAVKKALDIMVSRHGSLFCDFVKLYYWTKPRLKLEDIADKVGYSTRTVREWNNKLIKLVARNRGWI